MKQNMTRIRQTILRLALINLIFAMCTTTYAQEPSDSSATSVARQSRTQSVELREVCGLVLDAATHEPIDGARVQAFGNAH